MYQNILNICMYYAGPFLDRPSSQKKNIHIPETTDENVHKQKGEDKKSSGTPRSRDYSCDNIFTVRENCKAVKHSQQVCGMCSKTNDTTTLGKLSSVLDSSFCCGSNTVDKKNKDTISDEDEGKDRIQNLLLLPLEESRYENIISRTCYYAWYVLTRQTNSSYSDVQEKVLHSDRVVKAVEKSAKEEFQKAIESNKEIEYETLLVKKRKRASEQYVRLRSCISSSLVKIACWILYRLLSRIFTSIQFNKAQLDRIRYCMKQTSDKKIPVVYLPLHRSHLDYILISFILYMNNIKVPLVAAGDNLLIPFFGKLLRGLGAFFIQRANKTNQHKDSIYQAILHSYVTENLREGNSLEFFIEGGRTRSGKMVMPKLGMLKIIVDAVMEGAVDDVYIVPVSIAYEKLVDGAFVDERLGKSKKFENFSITSKAIWKTLHSNFGNVRVDFSKPFLLKEYLNQAFSHGMCLSAGQQQTSNCIACKETVPLNKLNHMRASQDLNSNFKTKEALRKCIESLASHVLYDAHKESALMSTHLVSFLLLTKYRKGVTLEQLAKDIEGLRDLLSREKGINFSAFGDLNYFVKQALNFLGKEQVKTELLNMKWSSWSRPLSYNNPVAYGNGPVKNISRAAPRYRLRNDNTWHLVENECDKKLEKERNPDKSNVEILYLRPVLKVPSALHLHYYANSCIFLFHLESIFATALFSYINGDLNSLIYHPITYVSNLTIDKEEFLERCKNLCNLFQFEFYFNKICKTLDQTIEEMYNVFVAKNIFVQSVNAAGTTALLPNLASPMNGTFDVPNYYTKLINRNSARRINRRSNINKVNGIKSNVVTLPTLEEEEYELEPAQFDGKDEGNKLSTFDDFDNNNWTNEQNNLMHIDSDNTNDKEKTEFSILLTEKNGSLLNFYCSVLGSYIESYWLTCDKLAQCISHSKSTFIDESLFLKDLSSYAEQMIQKEMIIFEESISHDTFKNALKYFESINAIRRIEVKDISNVSSTSLSSEKNKPNSSQRTITSLNSMSKLTIECDRQKMDELVQSLSTYRHSQMHRLASK